MTVPLDGIDLVIFDKDGTLIEFHAMWGGWAVALADDLRLATGHEVARSLFEMLGYDQATGTVLPHGGLAATPMARLHDRTRDVLLGVGIPPVVADRALASAWRAPDPVALASPLADLGALFGRLRQDGRKVAVATSDDRGPTIRSLAALGIADGVDAVVCADDGVPVKPAPDMVHHLCAVTGTLVANAAVVGDSPADLRMGRTAGAGLTIGVMTGVGSREDLDPFADLVIDSVAGLMDD
ncbi:MAG TPA: HAD family hydrolase [Candidatus Limnocylindrales bacterium]|nr:HAD family hydrolase [Candidatus Limnocylindrales bacterium]